MDLNPFATQSWSRTFNVWIEDIQVQFQPVVRLTLNGGILRRVRCLTKASAGLVTLFFLLHCSKPRVPVTVAKLSTPAEPLPPKLVDASYAETGGASWYGGRDGLAGHKTASGERLDPNALTCAHRTLPLGSYLLVENLENNKSLVVRINDRGPFTAGRVVDVTRQGAEHLGFMHQGVAKVRIKAVKADGSPATEIPVEADNPFIVQVASLSDPANVQRLSRELQESYGQVVLKDVVVAGGKTVTRVQVGSFTTLEDAERLSDRIAKRFGDRGVEPFITRRR